MNNVQIFKRTIKKFNRMKNQYGLCSGWGRQQTVEEGEQIKREGRRKDFRSECWGQRWEIVNVRKKWHGRMKVRKNCSRSNNKREE